MFQNLFVAPLGSTDEVHDWENGPFRTIWPEPTSPRKVRKNAEIKKTIKKKPKRYRTAFTTEQLRGLEDFFTTSKYIDGEGRKKLSKILKVGDKAIKTWFQNRRMKEKRDDSERGLDSCSSATEVSASSTASLCSPLPQIEFESMKTDSPSPYTIEVPPLAEASVGYCENINNVYTGNYHEQYQDTNNINYYNHGYYNHEFQQFPSNTPMAYPTNANFAYDSNVYPTHCYPSNNQFDGCATHLNLQN